MAINSSEGSCESLSGLGVSAVKAPSEECHISGKRPNIIGSHLR